MSPGTARYDRATKAALYASAGIPWYWLVDPIERLVEVLELDGRGWRIFGCFGEDQRLPLPPFAELEVAVGQLFMPRRPV